MYRIAVISDTHDNLPKITAAVKKFKELNVNFVIHAGDYIAPFSIPFFMEMGIAWQGVFGNNDGERRGLLAKSKGKIVEQPLELEIAGRKIIVVHEPENIKDEFYQRADLIIYGHTHYRDIRKERNVLVINPGEGCGYLTGKAGFALVDLDKLTAEFVEID